MTIREFTQWIAFAVNTIIMITALTGVSLRPDKRWSLTVWAVYGAIGFVFYFLVLILDLGAFGNAWSPVRSLLQDTIVATTILLVNIDDIIAKVKQWKTRIHF